MRALVVAGEVQGVGFREATVRRARELASSAGFATRTTARSASTPRGRRRRSTELIAFLREGPPGAEVTGGGGGERQGRGPRAVRHPRGQRRRLRRPGACRHRPPLRPAPGGGRDDALLGAAERARRSTPPSSASRSRSSDHALSHNDFEGALGEGGVIVWDRGTYEQGGRVAWPEALERGHAVFVLHGEKLRGGFALQRTRPGDKPQWLLIKRKDDDARPGSDVVAEEPRSVISGETLSS